MGCGRGLRPALGAAKRIASLSGKGHVTGIDVWSNVDMGANSAAATQRNLDLEGVSSRCAIVGQAAQDMSFPDASFNVILSTSAFTISTMPLPAAGHLPRSFAS